VSSLTRRELNRLVAKELPHLRLIAYKSLHRKEKYQVDADDIINMAYIILHEQKMEFSFHNMIQPIFEAVNAYVYKTEPATTKLCSMQEEKVCKKCKASLPVAMFHKNRIYANGLIVYESKCKPCKKEVDAANKKKRLANVVEYKKYRERQNEMYNVKAKIINGNKKLQTYYRKKAKVNSAKYRQKTAG